MSVLDQLKRASHFVIDAIWQLVEVDKHERIRSVKSLQKVSGKTEDTRQRRHGEV